jgi:phosphoglycolate phosphatase
VVAEIAGPPRAAFTFAMVGTSARPMPYRLAIFDFDGTLADTFPWFVGVLNDVADRHGFRRVAADEVDELRGMNARAIMARLRVPLWKVPRIARHMRELAARDAEQMRLFPGVPAMLRRLADAGVTLAVVTSNAEANVRRALGTDGALVRHYRCGASVFGKGPKLRRVLADSRTPAGAAIAIGDEIRDCDAARSVGLAFGAVTWGFATGHALRALGPDVVFESPEQLADALVRG